MKLPFAIALAILPAGAALAAPEAAPSVTVSYADLDLAKPQDAARLRHRVAYAVGQVCGGAVDIRDLSALTHNKACRRAAIADAAPKIEVAMAAARGGERLAALEVSRPAAH